MIFSSTVFVFIFFPIVLGIYYLSKEQFRNYILLVASLIFYAYGEPKFVFVMIVSIIMNWAFALAVDKFNNVNKNAKSKIVLFLAVAINISILFIYKYLDFSITFINIFFHKNFSGYGIVLPIGISFFTFQSISYIVDVYRGDGKVQKNPLNVGLYISFFPQLIAGPIVRYQTISEQIEHRSVDVNMLENGIKRFICGFCKKIILANNMAIVADKIFGWNDLKTLPVGYAWIGALCFTFQIYYDFSGYSDMAIGLGKMFGFNFQENFNYPYISKSVTEFWRRWHISLSQWFRDYIYIPLGGSRVGVIRHIFNMFVVWSLTGLWHGAGFTFILWGFVYFIALVIEKYIFKPEKRKSIVFRLIWQIITLLIVVFNWVMFNAQGFSDGIKYWLAMLGVVYKNPLWDYSLVTIFRDYSVYFIVAIVFSTPIIKKLSSKISEDNKKSMGIYIIENVIYIFGFIWAVSFLILGMHNPFIYFNF